MVYYTCCHMDPIFSRERVITFLEVVLGCDRVHSKPSQVWIRGGLAFGIHLTYTLADLPAEKHTFDRKWRRFVCTRLSRWKMRRLFSRRLPRLSRQHRLITFRVFHFKLSDCHAHWRDNYNYYTWAQIVFAINSLQAEEGCIHYQLYKEAGQPGSYAMIETWATQVISLPETTMQWKPE